MSTQVQRRKGTTAQHASFTGASAELTVDTTKNTVVVHDGATAGGIPLAKETGSALSVTSLVSSGAAIIEATDTAAALRITQLGTGNSLLVEDSSNPDSSPFVIDTAGRVAIGHTATVAGTGPSSSTRPSLQVHGMTNSTSGAGVYNWSSTAALTSAVTFNRSLSNVVGTFGGAVTSSTSLGAISFSGDDGTSFYESVRILAQADGSATTGSTPGRLLFYTTPSGTTTPVERLRIGNSGDITIAGGTANGVTYLNGSKVLTSGTALTFDGANLLLGATSVFNPVTNFKSFQVTGATGAILDFGNNTTIYGRTSADSNGLNIEALGFTPILFRTNLAEQMRLTSTGLGIGTSSPTVKLDVNGSTGTALTDAVRISSSISSGAATGGGLSFYNSNPSYLAQLAGIYPFTGGASQKEGILIFATNNGTTYAEKMRLDPSGRLLVGTTAAEGAGGLTITPNGSAGAPFVVWNRTDTASTSTAASFRNNGTSVGRIEYTNTATSYVTSSDYRLKNITGPITTSGAYIDSLKPVEGTWKADGSTFVGLIAHETQEASRTTVATGTKDGAEMQGMDYSSAEIIANLIAEIQDLRKRLAAAGI